MSAAMVMAFKAMASASISSRSNKALAAAVGTRDKTDSELDGQSYVFYNWLTRCFFLKNSLQTPAQIHMYMTLI